MKVWRGLAHATVVFLALTVHIRADDIGVARSLDASLSRSGSHAMVRAVESPDRASLDVAAWDRNPLFHYPISDTLSFAAPVNDLAELVFGGALDADTVCDGIGDTPLTEAERARPLAWQPLTKYLIERDYDRAAPLLVAGAPISAEHWGNTQQARPLQQIALAYLHGDQLWVKVEFRPEITWVAASDEDGDGYREIYARLAMGPLAPELRDLIVNDYCGRRLSADEVAGYFYALCSEWYPTLQTYLLEGDEAEPWPNSHTDQAAAAEVAGHTIQAPTAVIRGRPWGEDIYNVFVVTGAATGQVAEPTEAQAAETGPLQVSTSVGSERPWDAELARWGGSWEAWSDSLRRFQIDVRGLIQDVPADQSGMPGRDGWLFFRNDLTYLLSHDLRDQPEGKNPWPAIIDFRDQLEARGVDLLLVVIPTKTEIYPEKLSEYAPGAEGPWVAPYCRKLLGELDAAGVEVVDLQPAFMAAREEAEEPLYMAQDTHWTNRGLRLAAGLIARRVRQYEWLTESGARPDSWKVRAATCTRVGDIVGMLPEAQRASYRPMQLEAQQVLDPEGALYTDDATSPIVMLGDSFTGVFQFEDCQHAGLSAHLAKELGLPIDLIMAQGSGPRIRAQLARRGPECLEGKRLVIWTMVSRDLHNYWADWELIRLP